MNWERLAAAVQHPLTIGLTSVLAIFGIAKGGVLWAIGATFVANAGSVFGTASITLFVGERVGLPPTAIQAAAVIAVFAGLIAIVKAIRRFWAGVEARTK